jgi:hypothetical protein
LNSDLDLFPLLFPRLLIGTHQWNRRERSLTSIENWVLQFVKLSVPVFTKHLQLTSGSYSPEMEKHLWAMSSHRRMPALELFSLPFDGA